MEFSVPFGIKDDKRVIPTQVCEKDDGIHHRIFCQAYLNWKSERCENIKNSHSVSISTNKGESIMTTTLNSFQSPESKDLGASIEEAITEARSTCEEDGSDSTGCAVAWDIVEELQAEKSHQQQVKQSKTSLENYCDRHPDSVECLIYDV